MRRPVLALVAAAALSVPATSTAHQPRPQHRYVVANWVMGAETCTADGYPDGVRRHPQPIALVTSCHWTPGHWKWQHPHSVPVGPAINH